LKLEMRRVALFSCNFFSLSSSDIKKREKRKVKIGIQEFATGKINNPAMKEYKYMKLLSLFLPWKSKGVINSRMPVLLLQRK